MSENETKLIGTKGSKRSEYRKYDSSTIDRRTIIRYSHELDKYDRSAKSNNAILVAGFSGPGLVGSIGANYIIDKLDMHQIACIDSEFIVPGVIYVGGKLRHPFRLYRNKQADIYVLECEAPILLQGIHSVLDVATKWCVDNNIKSVIVLEGYPVRGVSLPNRQPIILSSDNNKRLADEMQENTEPQEAESTTNNDKNKRTSQKRQFANAYIGGISGGLLSSCLSNEIPCTALLIPTTIGIPDPEGAASLIEMLDKVTVNEKLNLEAKQLRKEGAVLRKQMEEIIGSVRDQQQMQQNSEGGDQSQVMYA
ncbi:MAG TPA: PAC2 family protein [Nitrososphaeraceae archaeon]|jgi:uncharacterized protein|nr:PAC2 family protein [Nitrososphaeraceae archaeon]